MLRYVARRLGAMVPLILVITGFVFLLGQYGAGDLAMNLTLRLNNNQFDEQLYLAFRAKLHQDLPVLVRFARFLGDALRGDFGMSYVLPGTPEVGRMILASLPISMQLALAAMAIVAVFGVSMGVLAAVTRNSPLDYLLVGLVTVASSIPAFVFAPLALVVLVVQWHILPTVGTGWHGLFSRETLLPAVCLAVGPLLGVVRYTRASVVDVLSQEYVRAARARGLSGFRVITRHVVKNSMTPVLTVLGLSTARLLSGSIFIETIFGIDGFGSVAVRSFQSGDIQTVAATTLFSALIVMVMNLLVDLMYSLLDPRVRLGS